MSQQINLFNPIFLKRQKHFSAKTMLESLSLILLGALGFYGYAWFQVVMLSQQVIEADKRVQFDELRLGRMMRDVAPREKSLSLEDEVKRLEAQVRVRQEMVDALGGGALAGAQGFSEHMRAFARQTMGGLWLTGFTIGGSGSEIAIAGRALNPELVPVYLQRLRREPVFRGGQFGSIEIGLPRGDLARTGVPYVEFRLQAAKAEQAR